jgi:hypothetical protein
MTLQHRNNRRRFTKRPDDPFTRLDLETFWGSGPDEGNLLPHGYTLTDVEAAWHALGPEAGAGDWWAWQEWGEPNPEKGAPDA